MAAPLSCCNPCAQVETVNVPGTEGEAGTDGVDGVNAFTYLTANLLIPNISPDTRTANVNNSTWMVIGQILIIGEGIIPTAAPNGWAHFQVVGIPDPTSVELIFLDYPGDTPTGDTLASGCVVSPAGMQGPTGP